MFGAHVTVSLDDQPVPVRPLNQIPRILHQTCKNETIPEIWADSQQSCLEAYSDFEYKLWTDERARNFLSSEYPWFLDTWDGYPFPIQRADAIRYFVLYHYGGIYLDMDTVCHQAFPIHQIESKLAHNSLFEATLPTGITNDIMISSARHPSFESAISRLPTFHHLTRFWARLQPYAAIMISTGPLFISLATADYLLGEPTLPSPTVQVINSTDLKPYITDLQTATWHGPDAQILKWLADKPLVWFILGTIGVVGGVGMRACFKKYPDIYGAQLAEDEEGDPPPDFVNGQAATNAANAPIKPNVSTPVEQKPLSNEPDQARKGEVLKERVDVERT
ncbi:hypothetical protein ACJZ2D_014672 [Fusarium nematophilum]